MKRAALIIMAIGIGIVLLAWYWISELEIKAERKRKQKSIAEARTHNYKNNPELKKATEAEKLVKQIESTIHLN